MFVTSKIQSTSPPKAPALTYLTVFGYAGTLTWSWKSLVILNHFSSKSLFMSSPKRLQVEGSASRIWAPGNSEKGRIIHALLGALSAPPDQPRAVMYYLAPWKTRMETSENLPRSDAHLVQSSFPLPFQLSHFHLHQLRIWLLVFNLPWISVSTNFVFLIHNHRQSPAKLFWYLNLFTVPRLLVVMTH